MKPVIEAFILCWNEEEIIRHTLNHYSTFCDKINILDNYSTDGTIDTIQRYFPEVNILHFDTYNEHRDDILLEVKNNCWKKSTADYIIICDADEFLYSEDIHTQLRKLKDYNVALPMIIGFNMGTQEFPGNFDIPIYQQVKEGQRESGFDKQIIFSPGMVKEINFELGCHECKPVLYEERRTDVIVEFKLLHCKYLGREYLYKKHEAYARRLSLYNIRNNVGNHYFDPDHIDKCFKLLEKHLYKVI